MTRAEKDHLAKLADLGCIACMNMGSPGTPAEIHHLRSGVGAGQRSGHFAAIPLCHHHHRTGGYGEAFHAGKKAWEARFGTELELLNQVSGILTLTGEYQ